MDAYFIPEEERPKIMELVRLTVNRGLAIHNGEMPDFVVIINITDNEEERLDFVLMGNARTREYFYESLKPVETNGVLAYMRIYDKD